MKECPKMDTLLRGTCFQNKYERTLQGNKGKGSLFLNTTDGKQ